jgi:pyridoxamine 5'-phosphate oxidase
VSSRLGVVAELRRADLAEDPLEQFRRWFEEARPVVRLLEAMAVATAAPDGGPSVRMLLLKPRTFLAFVCPHGRRESDFGAPPRRMYRAPLRPLGPPVRRLTG